MELAENSEVEITEEDVAQYLKAHSGFFLKRDDLLLELKLSHPSGKAVSLLERQVSLLRERNMDMRGRLNQLLGSAHNNDQLLEKTQQLTLSLIEAQGLDALVNAFNRSLVSDFKMDFSNLILFGNPNLHQSVTSRIIPVDDAFEKVPGLLKTDKATCGILRQEELAFLFPEQFDHIGSAAVIPLKHNRQLGMIAVGSKDNEHFSSNMGTLFLDYTAEILSRLLVKHLSA